MLFVCCGAAQTVQSFDLSTLNVANAVSVPSTPTDLALIQGGTQLAIASADSDAILVLSAASFQQLGTIAVPAGPRTLFSGIPASGGKEVLVIGSPASGTLCVVDTLTLDVLKTVSLDSPATVDGSAAIPNLVFAGRQSGRISTLNDDPSDVRFGQVQFTQFLGSGRSGFGLASLTGLCVAQSLDHVQLFSSDPTLFPSGLRQDSVDPSSAVPGSDVTIQGSFSGSGSLSTVLMRDEQFEAVRIPSILGPGTLRVQIPPETTLGTHQIWASPCSPSAISAGVFLACSPLAFEAVSPDAAIDLLTTSLISLLNQSSGAGAPSLPLQNAISSLQLARSALTDAGNVSTAMNQLSLALGFLQNASGPGLTSASSREVVTIAEYLISTKLQAVTFVLGADNADVRAAQALLDAARGLLATGDLGGAMGSLLSSLPSLDAAIAKARRLSGAQVYRIIRETIGGLLCARDRIKMRKVEVRPKAKEAAAFDQASALTGPLGHYEATAIGHTKTVDLPGAVANLVSAVGALSGIKSPTQDLQKNVVDVVTRTISRICDSVQTNVGPYDPVLVASRKCLASSDLCCTKKDYDGAMQSLQLALGAPSAPLKTASTPLLASVPTGTPLFQATGTSTSMCSPHVTIDSAPSLCLDPVTGTDPNPDPIQVTVTSDTPPDMGNLFVTIFRKDGMTAVRHLGPFSITTNQTITVSWDGKDDGGSTVKLKGAVKQETFNVQAEFFCTGTGGGTAVSVLATAQFTIA
ncbi:MAG TPA: hypothetical protein VG457_13235, partial [Planctomycetota bacterium]|nr:hypothetical protein [Planctomycetota bacterium]